ncbi:MAG TPA: hypothetical protein VMZ90_12725, partial [Vicinamibacterales bacterium]|nr:hypothetical protein [Vicinamibacterales bacterium]
DIDVPAYYSPVVWSALCLCLLWYLAWGRRRHFVLMGRALRGLKEGAGYQHDDLTDLSPALPWWLFPLPRRGGAAVTCQEFAIAGGWLANRARLTAICAVAFGSIVAVQCFTLWVSWRSFSLLASQDKSTQFLLHELTLVLVVLTVLWMIEWLRPMAVPDQWASEHGRNDWTRREMMLASAALLSGVTVHPLGNIAASFSDAGPQAANEPGTAPHASNKRNPRYKRKRQTSAPLPSLTAPNDALLNAKSQVIHYVGHAALPSCLRGIPQRAILAMRPVSFVEKMREVSTAASPAAGITPQRERPRSDTGRATMAVADTTDLSGTARFHQAGRSWAAEQAAEQLVAEGRQREAYSLLSMALALDPRSLRLYDRLAVLTLSEELREQRVEFLRLASGLASRLVSDSPTFSPDSPIPDEASWSHRLWLRITGSSLPDATRQRARHRSRCAAGVTRPREQAASGGRRSSFEAALAARVSAWQTPRSGWRARRARRPWMLPAPPQRCTSS